MVPHNLEWTSITCLLILRPARSLCARAPTNRAPEGGRLQLSAAGDTRSRRVSGPRRLHGRGDPDSAVACACPRRRARVVAGGDLPHGAKPQDAAVQSAAGGPRTSTGFTVIASSRPVTRSRRASPPPEVLAFRSSTCGLAINPGGWRSVVVAVPPGPKQLDAPPSLTWTPQPGATAAMASAFPALLARVRFFPLRPG